MSGLDPDVIKHAITTARAGGMRYVRLKSGESRFSAVLSDDFDIHPEPDADVPVGSAVVSDSPRQVTVESSAVGYVRFMGEGYEVGALVEPGEVVAEVVALGIANEVVSKSRGKVVEVSASEGEAVEFGQAILVLEAD